MKKSKEYRKKRMANDFAKAHKLRVAQAHAQLEAIEKVCAALGPLTPKQRNKIYRLLEVFFDQKFL